MAAGLKKGRRRRAVRGDSEISDLATVSSWGVISWPTSGHVLDDHLGIWQNPYNRGSIIFLVVWRTTTKVKKSVSLIWRGERAGALQLPVVVWHQVWCASAV